MRLVEGQGWVKETEIIEEPSKKDKVPSKAGSKLKNVTNMPNGHQPARDADADGEEDDSILAVGDKKTGAKVKEKANGTVNEGGMISPESLEA